MLTDLFYTNTTYCLEAKIRVHHHFSINLVYVSRDSQIPSANSKKETMEIFEVVEDLGSKWHEIKYLITPPSPNITDVFRFTFVGESPGESEDAVSMTYFNITPAEQCPIPSKINIMLN